MGCWGGREMWVRVLKGVLKGDRFPDTPLTFICISSLIGGLPSQLGAGLLQYRHTCD